MRNFLIVLVCLMVFANVIEFSLARRIKRQVIDKQNHTRIADDFVVLKTPAQFHEEPKEIANENVTNKEKMMWHDAVMEPVPAAPIAYVLANNHGNNNAQTSPKRLIAKDYQNEYEHKSDMSRDNKPLADKDIIKIMDSQAMGPARFFSLYYNIPLSPLDQIVRIADSILYKIDPDDDNMESENVPTTVEINSIDSPMPHLLFRKPTNNLDGPSFYNSAGRKEPVSNSKPRMEMEPNDIFNLIDTIFQNHGDHQPSQGEVETFCPIHGAKNTANAKGSCDCHLLKGDTQKAHEQHK